MLQLFTLIHESEGEMKTLREDGLYVCTGVWMYTYVCDVHLHTCVSMGMHVPGFVHPKTSHREARTIVGSIPVPLLSLMQIVLFIAVHMYQPGRFAICVLLFHFFFLSPHRVPWEHGLRH